MARLSTHVLDVTRGIPAEGLSIDLHRLDGSARLLMKRDTTNMDGRTSEALISSAMIQPGVYELTFYAGNYFRRAGHSISNPPFLDEIVIRFGIAEPDSNYHVPLLLSPYGYSTYRGS